MTVRDVIKDPENLTLTFVADFAAPVSRVWRVWAEPELLGKWWGPPGWPATFVVHEFRVGGKTHYYMQGPDGSRHYGGWVFTSLVPRESLSFDDYFADEHGAANPDLPGTTSMVTLSEAHGLTSMTLVASFGSLEQMEQLAKMGMVEGMKLAMGQIDALL